MGIDKAPAIASHHWYRIELKHHERPRTDPGLIETEGTVTGGFIGTAFEQELVKQAPLGRTGRVGDIR